MPSNCSSALSLCALLAVSGCSLFDSNNSSSTAETATLSPVGTSTESGTATLTDTGGSTQIAITTTGGTDTGAQSAVIRVGTCGSNGDVYQILNNVQNDESITTIAEDLSSFTGSKYYIDVSSSTDVDTILVCGEIP